MQLVFCFLFYSPELTAGVHARVTHGFVLVARGFLLQPPQDLFHGGLAGLGGRQWRTDTPGDRRGVAVPVAEGPGSLHPLTDAHPPAAIRTTTQCWRPADDVTPGGGSER